MDVAHRCSQQYRGRPVKRPNIDVSANLTIDASLAPEYENARRITACRVRIHSALSAEAVSPTPVRFCLPFLYERCTVLLRGACDTVSACEDGVELLVQHYSRG